MSVYLTKTEALERLTELRDQALTAAGHAEFPEESTEAYAQAHAYRLAMGIVSNIYLHCDSCDGYNCDPTDKD